MKKDLIDTIMEKEYHALTTAERDELRSFCASEEEYNQIKEVFVGVERMTWENPTPKAETKQRLDELFDNTYPKAAPVWYSSILTVILPEDKPIHRQPLAQVAAIALLVLLTVPFWNSEVTPIEQPVQMASNEIVEPNASENNNNDSAVNEKPVVTDGEKDAETSQTVLVDSKSETTSSEIEMSELAAARVGVASTEASGIVSSAPSEVDKLASFAANEPGTKHPDGVFIAVSQPASETPEMFDLLTATF